MWKQADTPSSKLVYQSITINSFLNFGDKDNIPQIHFSIFDEKPIPPLEYKNMNHSFPSYEPRKGKKFSIIQEKYQKYVKI